MKTFVLNIMPFVKNNEIEQSVNLTVVPITTNENGDKVIDHANATNYSMNNAKLIAFKEKVNLAFQEFINE